MIIQCKVRWLGLTKILGKRNSVQCAQKQYDIKGLFIGCLTAIWYFVTICRRNCVTTRNSWKKFQLSAWERRSVVTFCAIRGKQENQLNTGLIIAAWEELKCSPAVNEHAEILNVYHWKKKRWEEIQRVDVSSLLHFLARICGLSSEGLGLDTKNPSFYPRYWPFLFYACQLLLKVK